jgi:hypothetical protein
MSGGGYANGGPSFLMQGAKSSGAGASSGTQQSPWPDRSGLGIQKQSPRLVPISPRPGLSATEMMLESARVHNRSVPVSPAGAWDQNTATTSNSGGDLARKMTESVLFGGGSSVISFQTMQTGNSNGSGHSSRKDRNANGSPLLLPAMNQAPSSGGKGNVLLISGADYAERDCESLNSGETDSLEFNPKDKKVPYRSSMHVMKEWEEPPPEPE